jgi:hypothetical protein
VGRGPICQCRLVFPGAEFLRNSGGEAPLAGQMPIDWRLLNLVRQKKSWVDSGSGNLPSE